jgi:hypothetical protein
VFNNVSHHIYRKNLSSPIKATLDRLLLLLLLKLEKFNVFYVLIKGFKMLIAYLNFFTKNN